MKHIYLDYAATTPLDPRVRKAMDGALKETGNPSSLHTFGQKASQRIFHAREVIAKAIHARYDEIIFTGSATEANNLVLRGVVKAARKQGIKRPHIIISAIEHESIRETARDLEEEGVSLSIIPVSKEGFVQEKDIKKLIREETVLVSCIYANNEIGTIEPIRNISALLADIRSLRKENQKKDVVDIRYPLFHTDAVQAFGFLPLDVQYEGVDFMTLSAHKIYGPQGIGALYIKKTRERNALREKEKNNFIAPLITGGGQEFGIRSGTEAMASIVGFGEAVRLLEKERKVRVRTVEHLGAYFFSKLKQLTHGVVLNGPPLGAHRLPNNIHVAIPSIESKEFLIRLDMAGVAASAGPACGARSQEISQTLLACGVPKEHLTSSTRFTLGHLTTKKEIDASIKILKNLIHHEKH